MNKEIDRQIIATVTYHSTEYENEVPGNAVFPNQELPDDDWAYDEAKDNELQDKLADEEPNNNLIY